MGQARLKKLAGVVPDQPPARGKFLCPVCLRGQERIRATLQPGEAPYCIHGPHQPYYVRMLELPPAADLEHVAGVMSQEFVEAVQ